MPQIESMHVSRGRFRRVRTVWVLLAQIQQYALPEISVVVQSSTINYELTGTSTWVLPCGCTIILEACRRHSTQLRPGVCPAGPMIELELRVGVMPR